MLIYQNSTNLFEESSIIFFLKYISVWKTVALLASNKEAINTVALMGREMNLSLASIQ